MRPQTYPRVSHTVLLSLLPLHTPPSDTATPRFLKRMVALVLVLLLLPLAQIDAFAQQAWPPTPQYGNGPYTQYASPYSGQYAPNPQPGYAQPAYGQYSYAQPSYAQPQQYTQPQPYAQQPPYSQQPYAQQTYAAPAPRYDPGYDPDSPQPGYGQAQPPAQPMSPDQLQQLVAPIALYPDTLLAQILAAATYPAQVVAADHWLQPQPYAPAEQIAAEADAQTSWDPSVKALTAFPQVLAQMDRDLQWTTDLGNAYYNQPQDVLQTVQVMRQRAEDAGTLQSTPQQSVSYDQGYIQVAPANPQVVYVPAYNPWDVYGQPVSPYPGFSLLGSLESLAGSAPVRFGLGIAMAAFNHTPFGWAGWALNWLAQSIFFNHSAYSSNSTSVAHWASPRGGAYGQRAGAYGPSGGYRGSQSYNRPQENYSRSGNGYIANPNQGYARTSARLPENNAENRFPTARERAYAAPQGNYSRPAPENYAYNRSQPQFAAPARPQSYSAYPRAGGYGSGFYGNSGRAYAGRPSTPYASPQQALRAPTPAFSQRSYSPDRSDRSFTASNRNNYAESFAKPEHSGGFHLFGGGHNSEKSYGGGHAPKSFGGKHSGGGGSHHSSGHHH